VSNEELGYDIVKEAVERGGGKLNENKKDHHHVQKDGADLLKLRHIIQVQEDNIRELQREIIELTKLVDDIRKSKTSNDMAPPPATAIPTVGSPAEETPAAATPAAGSPAEETPAAATQTGNPTPTTATTQKTKAQAPRRTRMKSVVKRKLVKSSKLGPPFTTYPKCQHPISSEQIKLF